MTRHLAAAVVVGVLSAPGAAAPGASRLAHDPHYRAENARLAGATPPYPRAHLLVSEPIWEETDTNAFEAIQRIYRLREPATQRQILTFYRKQLGRSWHAKGTACLVSGRRAVVAFVSTRRRRL